MPEGGELNGNSKRKAPHRSTEPKTNSTQQIIFSRLWAGKGKSGLRVRIYSDAPAQASSGLLGAFPDLAAFQDDSDTVFVFGKGGQP